MLGSLPYATAEQLYDLKDATAYQNDEKMIQIDEVFAWWREQWLVRLKCGHRFHKQSFFVNLLYFLRLLRRSFKFDEIGVLITFDEAEQMIKDVDSLKTEMIAKDKCFEDLLFGKIRTRIDLWQKWSVEKRFLM